MISFGHILIIALVLVAVFGPTKIPMLGQTFGKSVRNFKKALHGKEDIDVTDSVKRLDD